MTKRVNLILKNGIILYIKKFQNITLSAYIHCSVTQLNRFFLFLVSGKNFKFINLKSTFFKPTWIGKKTVNIIFLKTKIINVTFWIVVQTCKAKLALMSKISNKSSQTTFWSFSAICSNFCTLGTICQQVPWSILCAHNFTTSNLKRSIKPVSSWFLDCSLKDELLFLIRNVKRCT